MHERTPESIEIEFRLRGASRTPIPTRAGEVPTLTGPVPRIAQVMALAIWFEEMIRSGQISDYADLARLGAVSRERISQITRLFWLAPNIQAAVLCQRERIQDHVSETELRTIASLPSWAEQRKRWAEFSYPAGSSMLGAAVGLNL